MAVLYSSHVRGGLRARCGGLGPGGELEAGLLEGADGEADLADVLAAALAAVQVLVEFFFEFGREHVVEVVGYQLDEFLASQFRRCREVPGGESLRAAAEGGGDQQQPDQQRGGGEEPACLLHPVGAGEPSEDQR